MEKLAAATLEVKVNPQTHKINTQRLDEHLTAVCCFLPAGSEPNVVRSWILLPRTQTA